MVNAAIQKYCAYNQSSIQLSKPLPVRDNVIENAWPNIAVSAVAVCARGRMEALMERIRNRADLTRGLADTAKAVRMGLADRRHSLDIQDKVGGLERCRHR
jgi:hypothetical protein